MIARLASAEEEMWIRGLMIMLRDDHAMGVVVVAAVVSLPCPAF